MMRETCGARLKMLVHASRFRITWARLVTSVGYCCELTGCRRIRPGEGTPGHNRLIRLATYPAPKPLSIFTTVTFDAQLFSMPSKAAIPFKLAP